MRARETLAAMVGCSIVWTVVNAVLYAMGWLSVGSPATEPQPVAVSQPAEPQAGLTESQQLEATRYLAREAYFDGMEVGAAGGGAFASTDDDREKANVYLQFVALLRDDERLSDPWPGIDERAGKRLRDSIVNGSGVPLNLTENRKRETK